MLQTPQTRDKWGKCRLSLFSYNGLKNKKEEIFAIFKASADKGHIKAANELGSGVEEDSNEVVKCYKITADEGDFD